LDCMSRAKNNDAQGFPVLDGAELSNVVISIDSRM
jgi:hypothetical protein